MKKRKFLFTGVLKIGGLKDFLNSLVKVHKLLFSYYQCSVIKGGSRAAATSKMECFVIIVNGLQPLTIITKHSILDVEAALDPPLVMFFISTFIVSLALYRS